MHKKENATGFENLPRHIAIIMDGNGRWASKRLLPRTMGHREGMKAIKRVVEACIEIKVQALTLYAFSTENWRRPKSEVSYLMDISLPASRWPASCGGIDCAKQWLLLFWLPFVR
jgi:undecaprenyl diphosphate synthase